MPVTVPRLAYPSWFFTLQELVIQGLRWVILGIFLMFLAVPLLFIFIRAFQNEAMQWIGVSLFLDIVQAPGFFQAVQQSVYVGLATVVIVIPLAYAFAFMLHRTQVPYKPFWEMIALLPLLAPSLLPGISLVYLFGNQGLFKELLGSSSIYGFKGIVLGEAFYTFPHALMVLRTGLAMGDVRLYEAAKSMGAGAWRRFSTITFPSSHYAVFSAGCLVFTLSVTDFGVPKVIGGHYNVVALEAYKAVVGQLQFGKGAAIGLLLLVPALLTFCVDYFLRKKQSKTRQTAQGFFVERHRWRDRSFLLITLLVCLWLLLVIGVAVWASFIQFWPYNLSFSLRSYDFDNMAGGGWLAWINSLKLALLTAVFGAVLVFLNAWLINKVLVTRSFGLWVNQCIRFCVLMPMAVPGLVLGLGYILFFNHPANPLRHLYGGMTLLVICTVVHFYTSAYLTMQSTLDRLAPEIEAAAASLKASAWQTLWRVTLPLSFPTILQIIRYLFVSAMTTVSAVVFLYSPQTVLAAVAVLNMDDAGHIGAAAAMSVLIMSSSAMVSVLLHLATRTVRKRSQAWQALPDTN